MGDVVAEGRKLLPTALRLDGLLEVRPELDLGSISTEERIRHQTTSVRSVTTVVRDSASMVTIRVSTPTTVSLGS